MAQGSSDKSIAESIADKLIAAHDGDVALLYIYMARTGCRDAERAAHDLCRTLREMESAAEKLERMGLSDVPRRAAPSKAPSAAKAGLIPPEEQLPEYTGDEIVRRTQDDGAFACLVDEAARVLGHVLGGADLKQLFGLYDHLAMPAEVIMELMNYCADLAQAKSKNGALLRTSMRRIVTEGYVWANNEILTLEQAEEYIRCRKERMGGIESLRSLLGIADRRKTKTDESYLSSWLSMGFGEEEVNLAYERTVAQTGSLKWQYMDTILKSWHSKGLHTSTEIEINDPLRGSSSAKPRKKQEPSVDFDQLSKMIDKV